MSKQEEKQKLQKWITALFAFDNSKQHDKDEYWRMRGEAVPSDIVLTKEDYRVGEACFTERDLIFPYECFNVTEYTKALDTAQSVVEQYFIRIGVY